MKPIKIFSVVFILIFLGGCNYLDQEITTTYDKSQIIQYYNRQEDHILASYTSLPSGYRYIDQAMMASASDEAEHTFEGSKVHEFNIGSWNAFNNPDNAWKEMFAGIRKTNLFMANADSTDLSPLQQNPSSESKALYEVRSAEIERWKHEARFLRAFYYFELVKRYGGVPIMTEAQYLDDNYKAINRNTLAECIDFIVSECDQAAKGLPEVYSSNSDKGRVTKGAALALKSRMLLYAASELYNNPSWAGGFSNPELIAVQSGDRIAKWKAAAEAARVVIDLPEAAYELHPNYRSLFTTFKSPEIIFTRRLGSSNEFEKINYPIGYDFGRSGTTPTQNMVDAYEMNNGLPITDPESGYDPQNPYSNRDSRLNMSIITNNSMYKDRPVEIWRGGRDGEGVPLATKTGYYLKKYVNENVNLLINATSVKSWHLIRLAEIYLNYAEALNESDPGNPDISKYVNMVRDRASMPPLPDGLTQDEMRERIRHERRVELAFEDHRLWDLRRWMQAVDVLNKPVKGVKIANIDGTSFDYTPFELEDRVFQPKMYFYPIPISETNIMENWIQNPSW